MVTKIDRICWVEKRQKRRSLPHVIENVEKFTIELAKYQRWLDEQIKWERDLKIWLTVNEEIIDVR